MTDRITHETVTFAHPFELADVDGKQPAGTYTIETVEEPIDGLSFVAYRRVSTTIALAPQNTAALRDSWSPSILRIW